MEKKTCMNKFFLKSKQKRKRGKNFFLKLSQICDNFPKLTLRLFGESVIHSPGFKTFVINLFDDRFKSHERDLLLLLLLYKVIQFFFPFIGQKSWYL